MSPANRSKRRSSPRSHDSSAENLASLRETIIDKLQVLTLRRPRALIIVAHVLDGLLDSIDLVDPHENI